ncbi:MAG: HIT domain-containing protein, partial [Bacteroidetes bacterium]
MNRLFSPWRSKYIETFSQPKDPNTCILCEAFQANDDDERLIVTRGERCFVIMNLYPYNSGHLMVVPYKHTSDFSELSDSEYLEIMHLLHKMQSALNKISHPDGFNIGSNLGKVAGAGIDQHIHFHIV